MAFKSDRQRKKVMATLSGKAVKSLTGMARPEGTKKGEFWMPEQSPETKTDVKASASMKTADGVIKGTVEWNEAYKQYHVIIDGVYYAHFDNLEEGIYELRMAGFKDIDLYPLLKKKVNGWNLIKQDPKRIMYKVGKDSVMEIIYVSADVPYWDIAFSDSPFSGSFRDRDEALDWATKYMKRSKKSP